MGNQTLIKATFDELRIDPDLWICTLRPAITNTLLAGGLAVLPTETSYMLGGDATNVQTMERLRQLKNRSMNHDISVMVADIETARRWTVWSPAAMQIGTTALPGPLTLVLPLRSDALQFASRSPYLGIRIPGMPYLLDLLRSLPFPVSATSANPSGSPEPYDVSRCVSPVDLVWDAGRLTCNTPSTVMRVDDESVTVLRQGAFRLPDEWII
ncbi:Sua5/YciO/YrdC/YwlC family protein [bacterium]|nr:Sua5/YciO/YrdC/YwlC family protein [candidate division CSSED10-310 bacterium]